MPAPLRRLLRMKEPVNALTHFTAFLAAIGGLVLLILLARNEVPKLVTLTVFGVTTILLYGASSLYHWIKSTPRVEQALRKVDHIAIYLLIAGTATPVFYHGLTGAWRWSMLGSIWGLALVGIVLKFWLINAPRFVSAGFYMSMGWVALIPIFQLVGNLPMGAIMLIFIGGVFYTIGAIIYATKAFNFLPNRFGFHEIFHLFVVAGTVAHFLMMVLYIAPM